MERSVWFVWFAVDFRFAFGIQNGVAFGESDTGVVVLADALPNARVETGLGPHLLDEQAVGVA